MPLLSVIIPVYNEEDTLVPLLQRIRRLHLPPGWQKEIVLVNDGSTDKTAQALQTHAADLRVFHHPTNRGKGAAVKTGLRHISGDYIIVQDADLEYDPRDILRLLKPVITGRAQIVFGSRNLHARNYPGHYLYFWGGKFFTLLFNLLFRTRFTDITTCYKLFPRSAVREILKLPSDDFAFDGIELTYALSRHGKVIEVPITYTGRKRGAGKKLSSWRDGWRFLRALFLLRFTPRRYFAPKRVASRPR